MSLNSVFYPYFVRVLEIELSRDRADYILELLALVRRFLEEKRLILEDCRLSKIVSLFAIEIAALNLDALYILCRCSQIAEEEFIVDQFVGLPSQLIHFVRDCAAGSPANSLERTGRQWQDGEAMGHPGSFKMPPQDLVESRIGLAELCNDKLQQFLRDFCELMDLIRPRARNVLWTHLHVKGSLSISLHIIF